MKKLLYYKPRVVTSETNFLLPGFKKFAHFFSLFHHDVVIVDRTDTIRLPVETHALFPIPKFVIQKKTYEEICNERAQELLHKAEVAGLRLYVFYSGGIDSTTVLISLFKNATKVQKENITVLLSENSIVENPRFYREHLLGKVRMLSSANFMHILGREALFVSGEHNDQLFGSDVIGKLMRACGNDVIHQAYSRDLMQSFFDKVQSNTTMNAFYLDIFEKLAKKAPVPIETNYHFLWWINFSLKWQTVFMRQLAFTAERNVQRITKEYIDTHYVTFYCTETFQLWSLNNLDKRIRNDWKSYKWVAKELIYEYTKDVEYRDNKIKMGSLANLMVGNASFHFIDTDFNFYRDLPVEEYYNSNNDFI